MVAIEDDWAAWCFDQAIGTFGQWVENKLAERDKKGKPVHRIETLLGLPIRTRKITRGELASLAR